MIVLYGAAAQKKERMEARNKERKKNVLIKLPGRFFFGVLLRDFLGSGLVGDDDLWYHHIPDTLCFSVFFLNPPSPRGLSAGSLS